MPRKIEINEFARRVEHVCDFFLSKTEAKGTDDRKVLEDLKNDAADIQFDVVEVETAPYSGLYDYIKGVPNTPEENIGKES